MRATVFAILALGSMIFASNSKVSANCCDLCEVDWSGLYIGGNTGWGWSNANWSVTPFGTAAGEDFVSQTKLDGMNGALLGGQIGVNWQIKRWVLGIEGDVDGTGINGYRNAIFRSLTGTVSDTSSVYALIDWLMGLHGRFGKISGPTFMYVTAGVVWEGLTVSTMNTAFTGLLFLQRAGADILHTIKTGWTVGAGCERMLASRWSLLAEYTYCQFGAGPILDVPLPQSTTANTGASIAINNTSVNTIRLGLNYKLKCFK